MVRSGELKAGDVISIEYDYVETLPSYTGYAVVQILNRKKATGLFRVISIWNNPLLDGEPCATLKPIEEIDVARIIKTTGQETFAEPVRKIKERIEGSIILNP